MAKITPFQAYRPAKGKEAQIAALPYDVYSRSEAKQVVDKNPMSFLGIDRAETQFPDDVDTYADCVYDKARELLDRRIADGDFVMDEKPCYYLYEQTMDGRVQTGIAACAAVDDYLNDVVKKHENTVEAKELDRIRHVDTCNAQTGPIFLAYRNHDVIDAVTERVRQSDAVYDFVSDGGVRNRVWVIDDDADIAAIQGAFEQIPAVYIADGHHRCASAVKVAFKRRQENPGYTGSEEFNRFLCVLFPEKDLAIMDYNRYVKDLNGHTKENILLEIKKIFNVKPYRDGEAKPDAKGEIGMYLSGNWYMLSVRNEFKSGDPVDGLDVSILQREVLTPILGIQDPRTDKRIEFVGGIRGLKELKKRVDEGGGIAFAMYPTSIRELFAVADAGRLMPPKSTWFEPKLLSGLFIHRLS
ncbi:MAG: DUF1015 domain-containing protein [Lachnospiraceae bacterium]|nr:DUF1015 domain-containing protein [Lachnospiraceae bacterium]